MLLIVYLPEVWEDDDVGGGVRVHVLVSEGHHQEEEVTDHQEQEALVEGGAPAIGCLHQWAIFNHPQGY